MSETLMSTLSFFKALYQSDDFSLAVYPFKNSTPRKGIYNNVTSIIEALEFYDKKENDLFYLVNPSGSEKRMDKDVTESYCFFIDIDNDNLPDYFALEPSAIISREDGKGHHIYWFFKEAYDCTMYKDREKWSLLQKKIIYYYKSDPAIHNPARIMRVPGTRNHKPKVLKEHGKALMYEVAKCDPMYYTIEEIITAHTGDAVIKKMHSIVNNIFGPKKLKDGDKRHSKMIRAAYVMHDYGMNKEDVFNELKRLNNTKLEDKYDETKLITIAGAVKYASNEAGAGVIDLAVAEQMRIDKVKNALDNWYYVETGPVFVDITKPWYSITLDVFNARFAHISEKLNTAAFAFRYNIIKHARQMVYEPGKDQILKENGELYINMWEGSGLTPKKPPKGRASHFLNHIEYLFKRKSDQEYVLDYLAHMVQKPREKIRHALIIIGNQGTGKSILSIVFKKIFGDSNVSSPNNDTLSEHYSTWAKHCQVCFIDEVEQADKKTFINKIKPFISEDYITIREMRKDPYAIKNYMSIIATTNSVHPLLLSKDDRRFMIIHSYAEQKEPEYYEKLVHYFETKSNEILWCLQQRDISHFKAGARPPMTDAKKEIIEYSKSDVQVHIEELFELKEYPFDKDLVCVADIIDYFQSVLRKGKYVNKNRVTIILREMGCAFINIQVRIEGQQRKYWCLRNTDTWEKHVDNGVYSEEVKLLFKKDDTPEGDKVVYL